MASVQHPAEVWWYVLLWVAAALACLNLGHWLKGYHQGSASDGGSDDDEPEHGARGLVLTKSPRNGRSRNDVEKPSHFEKVTTSLMTTDGQLISQSIRYQKADDGDEEEEENPDEENGGEEEEQKGSKFPCVCGYIVISLLLFVSIFPISLGLLILVMILWPIMGKRSNMEGLGELLTFSEAPWVGRGLVTFSACAGILHFIVYKCGGLFDGALFASVPLNVQPGAPYIAMRSGFDLSTAVDLGEKCERFITEKDIKALENGGPFDARVAVIVLLGVILENLGLAVFNSRRWFEDATDGYAERYAATRAALGAPPRIGSSNGAEYQSITSVDQFDDSDWSSKGLKETLAKALPKAFVDAYNLSLIIQAIWALVLDLVGVTCFAAMQGSIPEAHCVVLGGAAPGPCWRQIFPTTWGSEIEWFGKFLIAAPLVCIWLVLPMVVACLRPSLEARLGASPPFLGCALCTVILGPPIFFIMLFAPGAGNPRAAMGADSAQLIAALVLGAFALWTLGPGRRTRHDIVDAMLERLADEDPALRERIREVLSDERAELWRHQRWDVYRLKQAYEREQSQWLDDRRRWEKERTNLEAELGALQMKDRTEQARLEEVRAHAQRTVDVSYGLAPIAGPPDGILVPTGPTGTIPGNAGTKSTAAAS